MDGTWGAVSINGCDPTELNPAKLKSPNIDEPVSEKEREKPTKTHWIQTTI
jgi:hypothetical protein